MKKLKTQENNSKLKQKTQGFGKFPNFVFLNPIKIDSKMAEISIKTPNLNTKIQNTENAPSSGKFGRQGFFHYWELFHYWEHSQVVLLDELLITAPTEQCLNLAAKNYLCYVSWLRMCQLFTVLTGVIFQC